MWNYNQLYHHGVLGQKWGVRRYQNYDGTLKHPKKTRNDNKSVEMTPKSMVSNQMYFRLHGDDVEKQMAKSALGINHGGVVGATLSEKRSRNCQYCAMQYEINRRGYKSTALGRNHGSNYRQFEKWVDFGGSPKYINNRPKRFWDIDEKLNDTTLSKLSESDIAYLDKQYPCKVNSEKTFGSMRKKLVSQGEGARGAIHGTWLDHEGYPLGGHCVSYEVHNNSLYLVDTQLGLIYKDKHIYDLLGKMGPVSTIRLDNTTIKKSAAETGTVKDFINDESNKKVSDTSRLSISNGKKLVDNYLKEHPNSKLSDTEILDNIRGS